MDIKRSVSKKLPEPISTLGEVLESLAIGAVSSIVIIVTAGFFINKNFTPDIDRGIGWWVLLVRTPTNLILLTVIAFILIRVRKMPIGPKIIIYLLLFFIILRSNIL